MSIMITFISVVFLNGNYHEAIAIPVKGRRTYVDPTTYANPDEAIEEFAKEIEPRMLRLDEEIGAGTTMSVLGFFVASGCLVPVLITS